MYYIEEELLSEEQVMANDVLFTDEDEDKLVSVMTEMLNSEHGVAILKNKGFTDAQILTIISGAYLEM